ncbi:hypothetical protein [Nostoc sp.]|uniref:hypothetical protein n=1 Tax=Nostoc sp. TaxID=1180 RepID=UPI00359468E5
MVTILVVFLGVAGLVWLIMRLLPESLRRALNFNFTDPSANRRQPVNNDYSAKTKDLQADLLALLKGNNTKAKELLNQERRIRPGMSNTWYLEKIVDDIRTGR